MSWSIEIADTAYEDLRNIYAYIALDLRSPDDARNVLRRILGEIATLDEMPNRFHLYPREPLASKGVRIMAVGNYGIVSVG
ncbi:MAG: type II toxin-antitoxin system RelE/ParE family toxin [Kiritimatiellia bacterium]